MKVFEKAIIIVAILIGIAAIVFILTVTLGSSPEGDDLSLSPYQVPGQDDGLVLHVSGDVFLFRDGRWESVVVGDFVREHDYLKTFKESNIDVQIGERLVYSIRENTVILFQKLRQTRDSVQNECELLVGSILCKVEKLAGVDTVRLRTGTSAFGVRGTQFLLTRQAERVVCAVNEGRVAITDARTEEERASISTRSEITLDAITGAIGTPKPVSESRSEAFDYLAALVPVDLDSSGDDLVKIALQVNPDDAAIYLSGKLAGYGAWAGILPAQSVIRVTLKKSGYKEQSFTLQVKADENRIYMFSMELDEPEKGIQSEFDPGSEKIIDELTLDVQRLQAEKSRLEALLASSNSENTRLTAELEDAKRKIESALNQLQ